MRLVFGDHAIEPEARVLQRRGERVAIEPKVFDLLVYLIEHRDRVVSSDELLGALWSGVAVTPAALSRAAHKAREAVGDDGERQEVLRTEHGHGFRFVAEVSVDPAPEAIYSTPTRSTERLVAAAGVTALLVVAAAAWLLFRPIPDLAPARSVAVLPFANMSPDAAAEPFTTGIYDDILTHISKIRDLKVIARTTMERLDPDLSIQEIGTQLAVAAVLEGSVQRVGNRVRINVQLNDCKTETHLWAETYDRELTAANIFAIQSEIAAAVADALKVTLSPEERDGIVSAPTENLAAYESYLLGRQRAAPATITGLLEATNYFKQAIELDPSYALAYVGLADSYTVRVYNGDLPPNDGLAKAQAAIDKALELNDRLGEAYNSLAGIKDEWEDFEGSEAAYKRALELNPNYATTYLWYGLTLTQKLGRHEEALALFLRAAELNPLSLEILASVGAALESLGRFDEALAWYERSLEVDPAHDVGNWRMGFYHWAVTGRLDQAVRWYRRALFGEPDHPAYPTALGVIFLDLGDPDEAEYWFERPMALRPEGSWADIEMSFLHLYRGDEPTAVEQARKALTVFPDSSEALLLLRNHELSSDRYTEARALFEKSHSDLLSDGDPKVGRMNWVDAVNLALVLFKTGEKERANMLLAKSLRHIQTKPRLGTNGYVLFDVEIFALQGEKQKALVALRQAIDEGWRRYWWYTLKYEPGLESLHDEPEYQAMVAEIEADMAAQLARVREMERNGELEPISEVAPGKTQEDS